MEPSAPGGRRSKRRLRLETHSHEGHECAGLCDLPDISERDDM